MSKEDNLDRFNKEIEDLFKNLDLKTQEGITKFFALYNNFLKEYFVGNPQKCAECNNDYEPWLIPSEWWTKLPREYWNKFLCFSCYLKLAIFMPQFKEFKKAYGLS